jgi:lysozyme
VTKELVDRARNIIRPAEGLRLHVYDDLTGMAITKGSHVKGVPTIGYGRALDHHNGLRKDEAEALFDNDLVEKIGGLEIVYHWFRTLDDVRKVAIVEMAFPLGVDGIMKLRRFVNAIGNAEFELAASHLLASKFALDIKEARAQRLARMIRTGEWP